MSLTDLEQYLDTHSDPRIARIGVSFLDGFLAATIVGPHLVAQSRWLSQIFGAKLPGGQGDRAGEAAVAAIVARHDEILDVLTHHPQDFAPIFMRTDTGKVIAADWSDGFFAAIKLNVAAWQPLVSNPTSVLLMPIFVFCRDADGHSISAPVLAAAGASKQRLIGEGWQHIPEAVSAIRAFWLARGLQVDAGRETPQARH
ncbi:MAG: UPF0149 family protein [Hyphomicrobiaceae bacterium]